jgi:hypothetical protein
VAQEHAVAAFELVLNGVGAWCIAHDLFTEAAVSSKIRCENTA